MSERYRPNPEIMVNRTEQAPANDRVVSVTEAFAQRAIAKGLAMAATDIQINAFIENGGIRNEGEVCIAVDNSRIANLGLWMKFENAVNASLNEEEAVQ